jgi:hypothetical protein
MTFSFDDKPISITPNTGLSNLIGADNQIQIDLNKPSKPGSITPVIDLQKPLKPKAVDLNKPPKSTSIKPQKTDDKKDDKKDDPLEDVKKDDDKKKDKPKVPSNLDPSKYYVGLTIGSHRFNTVNGSLLVEPGSYLRLSSYQHNTCQIFINDEENLFVTEVVKAEEIKLDIGYTATDKNSEYIIEDKFVGKVYSGGRSLPHATVVKGVDVGFELQNSTDTSVQVTGTTPAATEASAGGKTAATSTN